MSEEKIPYMVENKERDKFTFYVKGTKPYLELKQALLDIKEYIEKNIDNEVVHNWYLTNEDL